MFYDYGTLKTYAAEDVYYLHKQFSFLPAQAIACGLYNVRPCVGDRWKRSVIDKLVDRINETLLALTIISIDSLVRFFFFNFISKVKIYKHFNFNFRLFVNYCEISLTILCFNFRYQTKIIRLIILL